LKFNVIKLEKPLSSPFNHQPSTLLKLLRPEKSIELRDGKELKLSQVIQSYPILFKLLNPLKFIDLKLGKAL